MTNTYYCKSCECVFLEDDVMRILEAPEVRWPTERAHPAEYSEPYCPICGDALVDAARCKICEEDFPEDATKIFNGNRYCNECIAIAIVAAHDREHCRKLEKELEQYLPDANHYEMIKDGMEVYYGGDK